MVNLNVDRINANSPYKVRLNVDGVILFETEYDVEYAIFFDLDDILLKNETYQFSIINRNGKKSPQDRKLRETIASVIYNFFDYNNATILYICETGDGKQGMRYRLFESWFHSSPRKEDFAVLSAQLTDPEGISNYAAIILRRDNPRFEEITEEFKQVVRLLSKPL